MRSNLLRAGFLLVAASLAAIACSSPGPPSTGSSGGAVANAPSGSGAAPGGSAAVGIDVGQRAPAFSVAGLDGRQISDVDLRAEGKPYILYFYATW